MRHKERIQIVVMAAQYNVVMSPEMTHHLLGFINKVWCHSQTATQPRCSDQGSGPIWLRCCISNWLLHRADCNSRCTKPGLFLTNVFSVVLAVCPALLPVWEVEEVEEVEVEESKKFHDAIRLRAKSKKIFVKRILRFFKWRSLLGNVPKCLLRINQKKW